MSQKAAEQKELPNFFLLVLSPDGFLLPFGFVAHSGRKLFLSFRSSAATSQYSAEITFHEAKGQPSFFSDRESCLVTCPASSRMYSKGNHRAVSVPVFCKRTAQQVCH